MSVVQAQAVLDLPLRRLASLERRKIEEEYKELKATIRKLQDLLRSPKKVQLLIVDELEKLKETYGDPRRTQIVRLGEGETQATVLTASDLTPDKTVWVSVTPDGQISRAPEKKTPRLSGKAAPSTIVRVSTRDTIYLVNEQGEAAAIAVHVIPETDQLNEGVHFAKLSPLTDRHPIVAMFSLPPKEQQAEDWYVISVSRSGMIKKTELEELPGPSARTFQLAKINDGDRLGWARTSNGSADLLIASAAGMAIRFNESEVRPMGLIAAGVMGIKLKVGDEVVGFEVIPDSGEVYLQRSDGQAKLVRPQTIPQARAIRAGGNRMEINAGHPPGRDRNWERNSPGDRSSPKTVCQGPPHGRRANPDQAIPWKIRDRFAHWRSGTFDQRALGSPPPDAEKTTSKTKSASQEAVESGYLTPHTRRYQFSLERLPTPTKRGRLGALYVLKGA